MKVRCFNIKYDDGTEKEFPNDIILTIRGKFYDKDDLEDVIFEKLENKVDYLVDYDYEVEE